MKTKFELALTISEDVAAAIEGLTPADGEPEMLLLKMVRERLTFGTVDPIDFSEPVDPDYVMCLIHDMPLENEHGYHGDCLGCALEAEQAKRVTKFQVGQAVRIKDKQRFSDSPPSWAAGKEGEVKFIDPKHPYPYEVRFPGGTHVPFLESELIAL